MTEKMTPLERDMLIWECRKILQSRTKAALKRAAQRKKEMQAREELARQDPTVIHRAPAPPRRGEEYPLLGYHPHRVVGKSKNMMSLNPW